MGDENVLIINNKKYSFSEGDTILDVARKNKIYIPTLCHLKDTTPTGACRVCLVEVEGARGLVVACAMPASNNMVVKTDSPKVIQARRTVIALLMISGNHNCAARGSSNSDWTDFQLNAANYDKSPELCDAYGACELQELAYRYQVNEVISDMRLAEFHPKYNLEDINPYIIRDFSRCILCGRCVKACNEVQVNNAIAFGYRGAQAKITTRGDFTLKDSDCVFCGECLQVCPVGALVLKDKRYSTRPWQLHKTKSTCGHCSTGCSTNVFVNQNKVVRVDGDESGIVNSGSLCARGRFANDFSNSPDRLTRPLVKNGGNFREARWDEAFDIIAKNLMDIKEKNGASSIAGLSSAKCTNEENYLMQKFMRNTIGTDNIDHLARLCNASTDPVLADAFGISAMTNSIGDIDSADLIFLTGTNTTESHPVIGSRIKRNVISKNKKLIVIDPRQIDITAYADIYLQPRPGTDPIWINGLINIIIEEKLHDKDFIEKRTENFKSIAESVKKYTPSYVEELTGIKAADLEKAARLYAESKKACIFFALGITRSESSEHSIKALANLAMLCGNIGVKGGGLNPLKGQNNAQGAIDMGCLPGFLPGHKKIESSHHSAGYSIMELFDVINDGKIKALYIMGDNPVLYDSDSGSMKKSLSNLDFLVVQDIFMTETAQMADVVLPSASFFEKDGTFTNTERRVQRVRKAMISPGSAKEDWKIIAEISNRMNVSMNYNSSEEIFSEITESVPFYAGITYGRIDMEGGIQWPCPDKGHSGTGHLYEQGFPGGKAIFQDIEYIPSDEKTNNEFPFILSTLRNLDLYQSGTQVPEPGGFPGKSEGILEINPADAQKLGISDSENTRIISRWGEVRVKAKISSKSPQGVIFVPFDFAETELQQLINIKDTSILGIPEFRVCAVRIEK